MAKSALKQKLYANSVAIESLAKLEQLGLYSSGHFHFYCVNIFHSEISLIVEKKILSFFANFDQIGHNHSGSGQIE